MPIGHLTLNPNGEQRVKTFMRNYELPCALKDGRNGHQGFWPAQWKLRVVSEERKITGRDMTAEEELEDAFGGMHIN